MCIKPRNRLAQAWSLIELIVVSGLFALSAAALASLFAFSTKSFAALSNYAQLDQENRQAMDLLTKEIRQAKYVLSYTNTEVGSAITIMNGSNVNVTYSFDLQNQQLVRNDGQARVLLTNCTLLNFDLRQRCPSNGNYGIFPVASSNWQQTVKVIQLTWKTGRTLPSGAVNSENIQTARIVIRKQQDPK